MADRAGGAALPPGPRWPQWAQRLEWRRRPRKIMGRCQRRYGDIFTLRVGSGARLVLVSHPDAVKAVFTADPDLLLAGAAQSGLEPVFGPRSLILLDGDEHLRQRRMMLPPFHGEAMARYGGMLGDIAEEELDRWPVGEPIALRERMSEVTLEAMARIVFGVRGTERVERMRRTLRRFATAGDSPRRRDPARAELDALIYEELAQRRGAGGLEDRDDILSLLMSARDEAGGALTDVELRDQLVTLLIAGHVTTAGTLTAALYRLSRKRKAQERLIEETRAASADGAYLEAVMQEVLRLRPPLRSVGRLLTSPWELSGWALPEGTIVTVAIHLVHRRPDVYPHPNAFRPERFLDQPPGTYTWIPFGGGRRRCIGAAFAQYEFRHVVRAIMRRARLGPSGTRAPGGGHAAMLVEKAAR